MSQTLETVQGKLMRALFTNYKELGVLYVAYSLTSITIKVWFGIRIILVKHCKH